jgi:hypothetical protein
VRVSGVRTLTVNGHPQPQPEGHGTAQRRYRLFVECMARLRADRMASARACGRPVGDGCGLNDLVARISPLFINERSLIRWVALRGAFAALYLHLIDQNSQVASPRELEQVMGLEWVASRCGGQNLDVAEPWRSRFSAQQRAGILMVALQAFIAVSDYPRLQTLNVQKVNNDPHYAQLSDALALDCIAWSAIALLRLGIGSGPRAVITAPEPDALPGPGWYPEPLWGKAERYWDGSDWSPACRFRDGHDFTQVDAPLR